MSYVIVATSDDGSVSVHGPFRTDRAAERWAEGRFGPCHGMGDQRIAWANLPIERPDQ